MRLSLLLLLVLLLTAAPAAGQSDAVTVEALARDALAAISARDSTAFMALMLPGARAFSVDRGRGTARDVAGDAAGLARPGPALLERMWEPEVRIAGALATVWTQYDFWVDGKFSHCGTDAFQMLKTDAGWRIASVAYNVQRDQCADSPLGPPSS